MYGYKYKHNNIKQHYLGICIINLITNYIHLYDWKLRDY